MTNAQSDEGDFGFQIAPMVDVIFVLLLFFMASVGLQSTESGLGTNIPADRGRESLEPSILLEIAPSGQVILNGTAIDLPNDPELPELRAWFGRLKADFGSVDPVMLRPAPETTHADVVKVLDVLSSCDVRKFSFN